MLRVTNKDDAKSADTTCKSNNDSRDAFICALKRFDFARLSFVDLNGLNLSKLVPTRYAKKIATNSAEIYSGVITFGVRNEIVNIPEIVRLLHTNGYLRPDPTTLHSVPWAEKSISSTAKSSCTPNIGLLNLNTEKTSNRVRVCSVVCDVLWSTGEAQAAHPRVVAAKMLKRLHQLHGLEVYSAFEPEFRVFEPDSVAAACLPPLTNPLRPAPGSKPPVSKTQGHDMYKTSLLAVYEEFFFRLDSQLREAGVEIQDYSTENGEGQLEAPLVPRFGLEAADAYFKFKQATREVGSQCAMMVSYMTQPLATSTASGCHYNHSLWTDTEPRQNAFYDKNSPDSLSQIARHWIAGIIAHMPALLAFCSPTVNCYRRLHRFLAPDCANWDLNDRFTSLRVKNAGESGTYMENRIVSSAACSYHVMAATLAAGMDGIERKLLPPRRGIKPASPAEKFPAWHQPEDLTADELANLVKLPYNLRESLEALRADKHLVQILGEEFVDWFIQVKERSDLVVLAEVDINNDTDEALFAERYEYLEYI